MRPSSPRPCRQSTKGAPIIDRVDPDRPASLRVSRAR
jgi:hypothetical protein